MPPTTPRAVRAPRRLASTAAFAVVIAMVVAACSQGPANDAALDGLVALVAAKDGPSLFGWSGTSATGVPIDLPKGSTTWVATGRSGVLAATIAAGTTATSDPVTLGKPLAWRTVRAVDQTGDPPPKPAYFPTWDPDGGRFAELAGDLASGGPVQVVVMDPSASSALVITIGRSILAAPPAWIDHDRLILVTGDPASPGSTVLDTVTGARTNGPVGVRLVAISADGARVATVAGPGAPVVIRDTDAWLSGDGSSVGSVDPPDETSTAIAFALDAKGGRLAIAWAAENGTVSLAVHDGQGGWRRAARPEIASATGAVVAWRR
jgi:hypothetical protein